MTTDELDQLLLDRFNLRRSDLIAALKTLPAHRPWAVTLTTDEARLLDDAGFTGKSLGPIATMPDPTLCLPDEPHQHSLPQLVWMAVSLNSGCDNLGRGFPGAFRYVLPRA